ncbi:MAG: DJ-1/PfpI family protein [Clostridia bacterium]|nr:DJ-1/PfpI family protein [Clostridia bacterium]
MVYILLAEGFEEIEALTPVDVLRRAGVDVKTVAVGRDYTVKGAHGIPVKADVLIADVKDSDITAVVLPGGMPGTKNLDASDEVRGLVRFCADKHLLICAICAAPSVLGHMRLLVGRKATCFPGFESELHSSIFTGASVTKDGNIITADGPGSALGFAEAIAAEFVGKDAAHRVVDSMMCRF